MTMPRTYQSPANLKAVIDRAAAQLSTQPDVVERDMSAVLKHAPNDPRALLIFASARRRQGDAEAARKILEPLARAYPGAANTAYELGAARAALGERQAAIHTLRHAVSLNPDHAEAWRALGDQLFLDGDAAGAETAFSQATRASVHDPRLKPAAQALFDGDVATAEAQLRAHLARSPNDAAALNMLAIAFGRQGRHDDAEILLADALKLNPGFDAARFNYATALFQQQKAPEALPQIEALLAKAPNDAAYRNLLAAILALLGEHERVNTIYEALLAEFPAQPRVWLNYAYALRTVGRRDEAIEAYKRCLDLAPELGEAYLGLANLKVATFADTDIAAMRERLARPGLSPQEQGPLYYALGKALEDAGDYSAAFENYARGAAIQKAATPYDPDEVTAFAHRSIKLFTPAFFQSHPGGAPIDDPIFILGLPRSGSTLIEQILASHSAVEGTMELPDIGLLARRLGRSEKDAPPPRYPDVLADVDAARLQEMGEAFIAATRVHRKLGRRFFIDKMPNNFHHIGLIRLILPRAKIIDARRHPLGACFSTFKQHFAQGQSFSYDLVDLGRYYRDYVELLRHFDNVLPGHIHRVIYEDMVEDTEAVVRRLLDYCGLPFEDGCLKFYENDRAVRTVSSEQVRKPIFRSGLEQWMRFEPWLEPLKAALGPALEQWRG
jgi:tetratricopeptide (TPR) repeat protein